MRALMNMNSLPLLIATDWMRAGGVAVASIPVKSNVNAR
jgi:hypothetical protein